MLDLEAGDESHPASQAIGFVDVLTATTLVFVFFATIITVEHARRLTVARAAEAEVAAANAQLRRERDALSRRMLLAEAQLHSEQEKHRGKPILIPNELQDHVLFPTGEAVISRSFYPLLDNYTQGIIADLRSGMYDHVVITGHTDNVPISRWCITDNWDLGAARALAIARFFIARGVPPSAITASSAGEFQPVGDNYTEYGRATNRRIAIVLVKRESGGS